MAKKRQEFGLVEPRRESITVKRLEVLNMNQVQHRAQL